MQWSYQCQLLYLYDFVLKSIIIFACNLMTSFQNTERNNRKRFTKPFLLLAFFWLEKKSGENVKWKKIENHKNLLFLTFERNKQRIIWKKMASSAHRLDDTSKIRTVDVTESTEKRSFSDLHLGPNLTQGMLSLWINFSIILALFFKIS